MNTIEVQGGSLFDQRKISTGNLKTQLVHEETSVTQHLVENETSSKKIDVDSVQMSFEWEDDPLFFVFKNEIPGKVKMHTRPLKSDDWVFIDRTYPAQMKLRRELLQSHYNEVFVTNDDQSTVLAKQELLEVLIDFLPKRFPDKFEARPGRIYNKVLKEFISADPNDEMDALIRCGELTQEDWCIMEYKEDCDAYVLTAGIVYFPMRWSLQEKFNQPMKGIHKPVEGFQKHLVKKVYDLFKAMSPNAPVWRGNWAVFNDLEGPLDLYSPAGHEERNDSNAEFVYQGDDVTGKLLTFRVEYQTLWKMPKTKAIVFSIRTYQRYLEEFKQFPLGDVTALMKAIETLDEDFYVYKGAAFWKQAAMTYLGRIVKQRSGKKEAGTSGWGLPAVASVVGVAALAGLLIYRNK